MRWREREHGQHIALGIARGTWSGLLGQLGATWSRDGQALCLFGTLYDPFVGRALEPSSFGIYAGGQLRDPRRDAVGSDARARGRSPSVSHPPLHPPGAATLHRLGAGVRPRPRQVDIAVRAVRGWAALTLLRRILRLSTRPIAPALSRAPRPGGCSESSVASRVPAPGYRLRTAVDAPAITLVLGIGALVPEVVAAAEALETAGLGGRRPLPHLSRLDLQALRARQGYRSPMTPSWTSPPPDRAALIVKPRTTGIPICSASCSAGPLPS